MTIRVGDRVRIKNPRWIKRVGYPLHWHDLRADVEADPRVAEFLKALGYDSQYIPTYFIQAVAKLHVEVRGFGGKERTIHYCSMGGDPIFEDYPSHGYVGCYTTVTGKRVAYTGTRFGPSGSGEDYENGGLEDRKAHVILRTHLGEIEACDVEVVE